MWPSDSFANNLVPCIWYVIKSCNQFWMVTTSRQIYSPSNFFSIPGSDSHRTWYRESYFFTSLLLGISFKFAFKHCFFKIKYKKLKYKITPQWYYKVSPGSGPCFWRATWMKLHERGNKNNPTCGGGTVIGAGMGTGIWTDKDLATGDVCSLCAASPAAPPFWATWFSDFLGIPFHSIKI